MLGGKCHFWVELGGSHVVGVGGEVMGTLHGDSGIIPHSPNAVKADADTQVSS